MVNRDIIARMLEELALTYEYNNEGDKSDEIHQLISVLEAGLIFI